MRKQLIEVSSLLSKGHIVSEVEDGMLHVLTTQRLSVPFEKEHLTINSYVYPPEFFRLPMRIDLTVKLDAPGLYLLPGKGHMNFGTPWSDNRRLDDIVEPARKIRFFHNALPMGEFVDISVIYGMKAMQILVNGEERFYSDKEKYMRSNMLRDANNTGFPLKIACDKRTNMVIRSLCVTEYEESEQLPISRNEPLPEPMKGNLAIGADPQSRPTFENCISMLPHRVREEVIATDEFLRSLRPMRFKRQVDKSGNKITYLASEHGFSYLVYPSNDVLHHSLSWYIITSGKPETWHRKADHMEAVLARLAHDSPDLAERLFGNLAECIGCCTCIVKTPYRLGGKRKVSCHGRMEFTMRPEDFEDARRFISAVNELTKEHEAAHETNMSGAKKEFSF